jgi:hypothetical protein
MRIERRLAWKIILVTCNLAHCGRAGNYAPITAPIERGCGSIPARGVGVPGRKLLTA